MDLWEAQRRVRPGRNGHRTDRVFGDAVTRSSVNLSFRSDEVRVVRKPQGGMVVEVPFLTLGGSMGPLPLWVSELVIQRNDVEAKAFHEFLDIVNRRQWELLLTAHQQGGRPHNGFQSRTCQALFLAASNAMQRATGIVSEGVRGAVASGAREGLPRVLEAPECTSSPEKTGVNVLRVLQTTRIVPISASVPVRLGGVGYGAAFGVLGRKALVAGHLEILAYSPEPDKAAHSMSFLESAAVMIGEFSELRQPWVLRYYVVDSRLGAAEGNMIGKRGAGLGMGAGIASRGHRAHEVIFRNEGTQSDGE